MTSPVDRTPSILMSSLRRVLKTRSVVLAAVIGGVLALCPGARAQTGDVPIGTKAPAGNAHPQTEMVTDTGGGDAVRGAGDADGYGRARQERVREEGGRGALRDLAVFTTGV